MCGELEINVSPRSPPIAYCAEHDGLLDMVIKVGKKSSGSGSIFLQLGLYCFSLLVVVIIVVPNLICILKFAKSLQINCY